MKVFKVVFVIFLIFTSCNIGEERCGSSSSGLEIMIRSYEERESYDKEKYPLGLYTREYYQAEAKYAKDEMQYFGCIVMKELSETEQISAQL